MSYQEGDRVRIILRDDVLAPLKWVPTADGVELIVGSVISLIEPITSFHPELLPESIRNFEFVWYESPYGPAAYPAHWVEAVLDKKTCTCDVWITGCRCGVFAEEMENKKGAQR